MARQQRSDYLDRLRHAHRLDSWQPDELEAALKLVDAARAQPRRSPHTVDLRLAIYRGRLQRELDRRTGRAGDITGTHG